MPKRYIDTNLLFDPAVNKLSQSARDIWFRAICVADLFGIVPFDPEDFGMLSGLKDSINGVSKKQQCRITEGFREILGITKNGDLIESNALGMLGMFNDKHFFVFKPDVWDSIQGSLVSGRRKSDYLRVNSDVADEFRKSLRIPRNSAGFPLARARTRATTPVKSIINSYGGEEGGVGETSEFPSKLGLGGRKGGSNPSQNGKLPVTLPANDPAIPEDLRMMSPQAETRALEVIRILKRFGWRSRIEKYQQITEIGYIADIRKAGIEVGYECLVKEALRFEDYMLDQIEDGKINPASRHNPKSKFLHTWVERIYPDRHSKGDTEHWPQNQDSKYAQIDC